MPIPKGQQVRSCTNTSGFSVRAMPECSGIGGDFDFSHSKDRPLIADPQFFREAEPIASAHPR